MGNIELVFAVLIAFNLTGSIYMILKFMRLHKFNGNIIKKETAFLSVHYGATLGIMFWGFVIGFVTQNLFQITFISSALSLLPCSTGVLRAVKIKK